MRKFIVTRSPFVLLYFRRILYIVEEDMENVWKGFRKYLFFNRIECFISRNDSIDFVIYERESLLQRTRLIAEMAQYRWISEQSNY